MKDHEEILSAISALNLVPNGKFSAKLGFDERCQILALHRNGIGRAILAEAYGIDRRTVTHIHNPRSPHYSNVREEEEKLGREAFQRKYITESALERLKKIAPKIAARDADAKVPKTRGKRSHSKHGGVHLIESDNLTKPHRVLVDWCESTVDNNGAGWYYRDMDGDQPNEWFDNGPESRESSTACLIAVRQNLVEV
jgi:hypothetical protein